VVKDHLPGLVGFGQGTNRSNWLVFPSLGFPGYSWCMIYVLYYCCLIILFLSHVYFFSQEPEV
jgi:hypothetical protein